MPYLADTKSLVADRIISPDQAQEIALRSRATLVALAINALLCAGVLAATLGLVVYLGDPLLVAVFGCLALILGLVILVRGGPLYRIFGNATALIGAGMLLAGTGVKMMELDPFGAAAILFGAGMLVVGLALLGRWRGPSQMHTALGAILVMGVVLHLTGLYLGALDRGLTGWPLTIAYGYAFGVILATGVVLDLRPVSALAIVPFAQLLSRNALSGDLVALMLPHPTWTIVQMALLFGLCLALQGRLSARPARQSEALGAMAFLLINVNFLTASFSGDVIGHGRGDTGLILSANLYAVVWAVLLIGMVIWAAMTNRRGLFNVAMSFAIVHAIAQAFQSFGDNPLAYVFGGLAAVPLAWAIWRANDWIKDREGVPVAVPGVG